MALFPVRHKQTSFSQSREPTRDQSKYTATIQLDEPMCLIEVAYRSRNGSKKDNCVSENPLQQGQEFMKSGNLEPTTQLTGNFTS